MECRAHLLESLIFNLKPHVLLSNLNEEWICSGERHLWHVNDSLGADDEATKVDGLVGTAPSAVGVVVLVGEGDLSAVLILTVSTI